MEARKKRLNHAFGKIIHQLKEMGALKIIALKSTKEWFKEIYDNNVEIEGAADILPFTERELKEKIKTSSFIRYALTTGRVVYEKG